MSAYDYKNRVSNPNAWAPAAFTAAVIIAAQVGGKATRDAVFLSAFDASELPKAMLTAALLSGAGVLAMAQGLARFGPARLVPLLFGTSAATYALEWWLLPRAPGVAAVIVYLHVAALGSLLISGFWSVVSERFDPHTAKRLIGRINAGAAVGGLVGGITAERVAAWLDARSMILVLGGMHVAAALSCLYAARGTPRSSAEPTSALAGFTAFRETPYLRLIAALAALTALTSGVIDYAFKAEAAAVHQTREGLMSLFAIFYTATSLVTVIAQTALSRRTLGRLGIGGTVALLPAAVVLGGAVALAFTRLWAFIAAAAAEQVLSNSLYRSGYELLFTPLSPERSRPTKALIDVGFDRAGSAIGGALMLGTVALMPSYSALAAVAFGVVASAGALLVALRLHRGYVEELARSLRSGRVTLSDSDIMDATTRRTLADTTMALDREQLLREIELLRKEQAPTSMRAASTRDPSASTTSDPVLVRIEDLLSGDSERTHRALKPPVDRRLVAYLLPLLGDASYARSARKVLMQLAPKVVGQLIDALLDPDTPPAVRRRLPDIVAQGRGARAANGLFLALADGERAVRERACGALVELVRADPSLAPPRERVLEAARREIAHVHADPTALPHLFRILGLSFDADALDLSLAALRSDDARLRGTSFEYLENVLPDDLRAALWPAVKAFARAVPAPSRGPRRSQRELADELRRSRDAIHIDRDALRKA